MAHMLAYRPLITQNLDRMVDKETMRFESGCTHRTRFAEVVF